MGKYIKKFNEESSNLRGGGMTVAELREHLSKFDDDLEVMILDGFNGQGNKRIINFNPSKPRTITQEEADDLGDCEFKAGSDVVILGYGFY